MLRAVSDYKYVVQIELTDDTVVRHESCTEPGWDEHMVTFYTLDGALHMFNLRHVIGFWFKQQEKK